MVSTDGRTDGRTDGQTDGRTDRRTDTEGYNIIPRHTLVAGYKNAYKQLFYAKKMKHPSTPSNKHNNFFRYYIVSSEINQNMAAEGLNCVLYVIPLDMFSLF